MFGRGRLKATAIVQYCEEVVPKHGINHAVVGGYPHDVIVDVQPEGAPPFRATTQHPFHMFAKPGQGDSVLVSYDPKAKDHDVHLETKGDARYDLEAREKDQEAANLARKQAILRGDTPPPPGSVGAEGFTYGASGTGYDAPGAGFIGAGMGAGGGSALGDAEQLLAQIEAQEAATSQAMATLAPIVAAEQQRMAAAPRGARLGMGMAPHAIMENGTVTGRGLLLDQIAPGGPAATAGLASGDVLISFNGQPLTMPSDVAMMLTPDVVGRPIAITINRGGTMYQTTVTPAPPG